MATKKESKVVPENVALFDKLVSTISGLERKGKENPYTSHNGNMFTILQKGETLGIRLPEKEREAFIKKYKSKLIEAYGIVLKEYVVVPGSLLKKTAELKPWLASSFEYVKTLKPKPTKKK